MIDLLDPRQRQAASLLLGAIDLPCECLAWAAQLAQAASVCPGVTIDAEAINSRKVALMKARRLVDELLLELANG